MVDGCVMKSTGLGWGVPGIAHTVLLHWELHENRNVLVTHGGRCKSSLSFLMRAGGPLKKSQIY